MSARNLTLPIDFGDGEDSDKPLPEWIVERLGGTMDHIDSPDGGPRLYAIRDWVYCVSGSRAKQRLSPWTRLKRAIAKNDGTKDLQKIQSLEIETAGGPQKVDFTTAEGLYEITMRMGGKSRVVQQVKKYLARSGVLIDEWRLEPVEVVPETLQRFRRMGKSDPWIQALSQESVSRKHMMAALNAAVYFIIQGWEYTEAADTVLLALYDRRAADLKAELGLANQDGIPQHQPIIALSYQAIAQDLAAQELGDRSELNWEEARSLIYSTVKLIGQQVQATSKQFKIDVATGRRLLPSPKVKK